MGWIRWKARPVLHSPRALVEKSEESDEYLKLHAIFHSHQSNNQQQSILIMAHLAFPLDRQASI